MECPLDASLPAHAAQITHVPQEDVQDTVEIVAPEATMPTETTSSDPLPVDVMVLAPALANPVCCPSVIVARAGRTESSNNIAMDMRRFLMAL